MFVFVFLIMYCKFINVGVDKILEFFLISVVYVSLIKYVKYMFCIFVY